MVLTADAPPSASTSSWTSKRWVDVLREFYPEATDLLCPLSHDVMFDPVTAEDGVTYERLAIEKWLDECGMSPMVREASGTDGKTVFRKMGKVLHPNKERKAALDRVLREFQHMVSEDADEPEIVEWDAQGLQSLLSAPRSITLSSPVSIVPPPAQQPRAMSDMTSDLIKMFKVLDPLRGELKTLVNLTPPKIVVIGDESAGKSTVLEQLIRMPLFPRKRTFCTRLPIHVRLRRPDLGEQAEVKLSVVSSEDYRNRGRDAEPLEPPCTIAIASGYHFVQDKMDELESSLAGDTGGVVSDRIIVLDVQHPEVPVIDLVDLPGIVTVNVNAEAKREAVESVISSQIAADRDAGMTSFYLVVVPAGERPNTNGALKYLQSQGLLDRAIGVFTKADEVKRPEDLTAFITGADYEDEDDGITITAASLGEVKLDKGWTATMLAMPNCTVVRENGKRVNYYTEHATERLKKQEEREKLFFGGPDANAKMRELYDQGFASTGALAAKLTRMYLEYSRGEWLEQTLTKLLVHEVELKSECALLGATDDDAKDELAEAEVEQTLEDGTVLLSERFMREELGTLIEQVKREVSEIHSQSFSPFELDDALHALRHKVQALVDAAVERVSTFYADEIALMLSAPMRAVAEGEVSTAPGLKQRFWIGAGKLVRSLFGATTTVPTEGLELHKMLLEKPMIQLAQYPTFVEAVSDVIGEECKRASKRVRVAASHVLSGLTSDTSFYMDLVPKDLDGRQSVCVHMKASHDQHLLLNALHVAFLRYLPAPEKLKKVVRDAQLKLRDYSENDAAQEQRKELREKIERVREATRGLLAALDVDEANPLDGAWLRKLQEEHGLPTDDPVREYVPSPTKDAGPAEEG